MSRHTVRARVFRIPPWSDGPGYWSAAVIVDGSTSLQRDWSTWDGAYAWADRTARDRARGLALVAAADRLVAAVSAGTVPADELARHWAALGTTREDR